MLSPGLIGRGVRALGRVEAEVLPWRAPGWREASEESETSELAPGPAPVASVWVRCPCEGTVRMGGRTCPLCAGSGKLKADVAEDPADSEEMELEAGPTGDG